MKRKRLRVLHAPVIAMYFPVEAVKGLRKLGHKADYMVFDDTGEGWLCNYEWDINLKLNDESHFRRFEKIVKFIMHSIRNYDVIHFHSGRTLIPLVELSRWSFIPDFLKKYFSFLDYLDLPLLKRMGKKIVFQFWGCDIRPREIDKQYKYSCCRDCQGDMLAQCTNGHKEKMYTLVKKYGDLMLGEGDIAVSCPDFVWLNNAIDTSSYQPISREEIPEKLKLSENGAIKIYHSHFNAEARGNVKGTKEILEAIKTLEAKGHKLELIYFSRMPRDQLKYYQMQADIVIDQLRCGSFGSTAVECMSLGRPVISYLREDVAKEYPKDLPIINADFQTLANILEDLVCDPRKRKEIGNQSRLYAVREHDTQVIAQRLETLYYSLYSN